MVEANVIRRRQAQVVINFLPYSSLCYATTSLRTVAEQTMMPMPPSPPAVPLIGHLHLVAGGLPHVRLRDLAARQQDGEGLMLLRLGTVPTLVVSSPHAAQQVLRAHDKSFASRPRTVVGDILSYGPSDVGLAPYGEWWRQAKKLVTTHLLSARKVQCYRAAREEEVTPA